MDKITLMISNIVNSVQVIVDVLINLVFQPIFAVITIVQSLIEIWSPDEEEQEPQQTVTTYPSTNENHCVDEVELPIGRRRIGFHTNQEEVDELNKVREQLNK